MKKITLIFPGITSMWEFIDTQRLINYSATNSTCVLLADSLTASQIGIAVKLYKAKLV